MDIYIKYGIEHVRSVLDISEKKYDKVWEIIFDFMAIAHDGFYQHAIYNREKYAEILQMQGAKKVKKLLGIEKEKYINFWERILNMLLETAVNTLISDRTAEFALRAFTMMMNVGRKHRVIHKVN